MIEFPITLTSGGSVCLPGHAFALALGYTKNRGVYQLAVTATGEWEGLAICMQIIMISMVLRALLQPLKI